MEIILTIGIFGGMKPKKIEYQIRTFEELANLATEENVGMLCGNLYGCVMQFIEMRKIEPTLIFTGMDWIDDGKLEIRNPNIKLVVTKDLSLISPIYETVRELGHSILDVIPEMSVRTANVLKAQYGEYGKEDIRIVDITKRQFLRLRCAGIKSWNELEAIINKYKIKDASNG